MYSDIYSMLTLEERKVLEDYHKKVEQSQSKSRTITERNSKTSPKPSYPSSYQPTTRFFKNQSSKSSTFTSAPLKKTLAKSASGQVKSRLKRKNKEIEKPGLKYEIEKLLRAIYRHSVICEDFKEDIQAMGGISLLDEYLKYRDINI